MSSWSRACLCETASRANRKARAMAAEKLSSSRDKREKGYEATSENFNGSVRGKTGSAFQGLVEISSTVVQDGGVAAVIWKDGNLCRQMDFVSTNMKQCLTLLFGVTQSDLSPFCDFNYRDHSEDGLKNLATEVESYLSK